MLLVERRRLSWLCTQRCSTDLAPLKEPVRTRATSWLVSLEIDAGALGCEASEGPRMRKKLRVVDGARNYMRVQVVPVVIAVAQMLFEKVLKSVLWVGNGLDIVKPLHMTSHGTTPNLHEGGLYGPVVREKPGLEHLELANQGDAFERNPVVAERTVNLPNITVHARFFLSFFPTCWLEVPKDNHALAAFI